MKKVARKAVESFVTGIAYQVGLNTGQAGWDAARIRFFPSPSTGGVSSSPTTPEVTPPVSAPVQK